MEIANKGREFNDDTRIDEKKEKSIFSVSSEIKPKMQD